MPHGGARTPAQPAPVSGPGRMSRRTDGQPVRAIPGQPYGQGQALEQQQAAAPMQSASPPGAGGPPAPAGHPDAALMDGVFGPSSRPNEPVTAGAAMGPGEGPPPQMLDDDPDMLLRAMFAAYPHPDLERLLARRAR